MERLEFEKVMRPVISLAAAIFFTFWVAGPGGPIAGLAFALVCGLEIAAYILLPLSGR